MKIDCVLTSCNENTTYLDFIPTFIKAWNKYYPEVNIKIIYIGKNVPIEYEKYENNIICFDPPKKFPTSFVSQYIRMLYTCLLDYKNGVLITDIDMIPLNRSLADGIKNIDDSYYICYHDPMYEIKQIYICYNIALVKIWKEIFNINSELDILSWFERFNKEKYLKNKKYLFSIDQVHLFKYVMKWNKKTNKLISLKSKNFKRLCRGQKFELNENIKTNIKNGYYSDYHMYRPYKLFKKINDEILSI